MGKVLTLLGFLLAVVPALVHAQDAPYVAASSNSGVTAYWAQRRNGTGSYVQVLRFANRNLLPVQVEYRVTVGCPDGTQTDLWEGEVTLEPGAVVSDDTADLKRYSCQRGGRATFVRVVFEVYEIYF
jgi:hypothetical protein